MSGNPGDAYEQLTQQIFQDMLDAKGVVTLAVERNVVVRGIAAKHKIDILWKFNDGLVDHTVIVECKDHGRPAELGDIQKFHSTLSDIPGQPRGVFVSRSGYQSGARDYAECHGIKLYELRKPTQDDWKGRIRNIAIDLRMIIPEFQNHHLDIDESWFIEHRKSRGLPDDVLPTLSSMEGDDEFEDADGKPLFSANDLLNELVPKGAKPTDWETVTHRFKEPTFLPTKDPVFPRLKIVTYRVDIRCRETPSHRMELRGDEIVRHILIDVFGGNRVALGANGKPIVKP